MKTSKPRIAQNILKMLSIEKQESLYIYNFTSCHITFSLASTIKHPVLPEPADEARYSNTFDLSSTQM